MAIRDRTNSVTTEVSASLEALAVLRHTEVPKLDSVTSLCVGGIVVGLAWAGVGLWVGSRGYFNALSYRGPMLGLLIAVASLLYLIFGEN